MHEITPTEVTPQLAALLPTSGHIFRRCQAVLAGVQSGYIFTDDPQQPTWAVVQERSDGTLYLGGTPSREIIATLVERLRPENDVVFGAPDGDPDFALFPAPEFETNDIDFWDRDPAIDLEQQLQVPEGLRLVRIDAELLPRCEWAEYLIDMFGGIEQALTGGLGYCLLDGDTIASEAFAGPLIEGTLEMGTITHEDYRRRGLAAIVCARTVLECERLGYVTWWSCSTKNLGSAAIARRLGYRQEQEYRVIAWFPPDRD